MGSMVLREHAELSVTDQDKHPAGRLNVTWTYLGSRSSARVVKGNAFVVEEHLK